MSTAAKRFHHNVHFSGLPICEELSVKRPKHGGLKECDLAPSENSEYQLYLEPEMLSETTQKVIKHQIAKPMCHTICCSVIFL
jgi:hypothetical protein